MWGITAYFVFGRCTYVEGAVLWVLPCCVSVAGATHGALLQASSWFPGASRPPTLAGKPSGF